MKNIMLVEDEVGVIEFIKKGLMDDHIELSIAMDGQTAIDLAISNSFDLIILDIMLPIKNGIEVCREIRENEVKTPIIFLTALGTSENIVHGLNMGADDYLVKPFKFIELKARIHALMRRGEATEAKESETQIFKMAGLIVNDDAKSVYRDGVEISLTATEYRLILALIKNKNKVLSRMELLESAWDINFNLATNVVDVYINYLRKKIDTEHDKKLIHTVVGMGYVLKEK